MILLRTCVSLLIAMLAGATTHPAQPEKPFVYGVFTGTTPCNSVIRPLHAISPEAECSMVQWKLVLYMDMQTRKPSTYQLSSVNRFFVRETNMYSQPGVNTESKGKWSKMKLTGLSLADSAVRLETGNPAKPVLLLPLGDKLLHVLDEDGKLMIGNPFFNYTLTRLE